MHQDYVMRMIQQMAVFITRVLRLREDGEYDEAIVEITHAYGRLAGLPASMVHALSDDDLIALLGAQGRIATDRCVALAELLREEGMVYDDQGNDDEALPRFVKALRLYLEALADEESLRAADIPGLDEVVQWVSWYPLSAGTRGMLLPYLEETGQFDQLENVVAAWLEHDGGESARAYASEMYHRLALKSDSELIVGGLTRGEVAEALSALHRESNRASTS
ncbi:hypothetical protein BH23CHL4_BH23CHL4_02480 [soil metagenome]